VERLLSQLSGLSHAETRRLVHEHTVMSAEDFAALVNARLFYAAIVYAGRDRSPEQVMITDSTAFPVLVKLLSDPVDVECGLYFLGKIHSTNFSPGMLSEAVKALNETMERLSYCLNPILVCVLALEQLFRGKDFLSPTEWTIYHKHIARWEAAANYIDQALVRLHYREVSLLYLAKDLRGRPVLQTLRKLPSTSLISSKGLGLFLDYAWGGPYHYDYHPMEISTLYNTLVTAAPAKNAPNKTFFLSFKAWVMSPSLRFMVSLGFSFVVTFTLQFEFLRKADEITDYFSSIDTDSSLNVPIVTEDQVFDLACAYSISCGLYYVLLGLYCSLEGVAFKWTTPLALSSLVSAVGGVMFELVLYSGAYRGVEQVQAMKNWVAVWQIGLWLRILHHTELTQRFGVLVKTIRSMLFRTLGFSLILGMILYIFSSIFLLRSYKLTPESQGVKEALFFFFCIMLGNFDPQLVTDSQDSWMMPLVVLFIVTVTIILLNLLVAILTSMYESTQEGQQVEYRHILLEYVSCNLPSEKYRLLNCSIPPLSLVALPLLPCMFTSHAAFVSTAVLKLQYTCCILPFLLLLFLVLSLIALPPAYLLRLCRGGRSTVNAYEEPEQTNSFHFWGAVRWLFLGPWHLLYVLVGDMHRAATILLQDVEPELLRMEGVRLEASESGSLLSISESREDKNATVALGALHYARLAQSSGVDKETLQRVCRFERDCVSPWLSVEQAEKRFCVCLALMDVEVLSAAVLKARKRWVKKGKEVTTQLARMELLMKEMRDKVNTGTAVIA